MMTNPINPLHNAIVEVSSWTYVPTKMIAIGAPCAFILFGPKQWVDIVLQSKNIPEILNPWIGMIFLYTISFFIIYMLKRIAWYIAWPVRRLKKAENNIESYSSLN